MDTNKRATEVKFVSLERQKGRKKERESECVCEVWDHGNISYASVIHVLFDVHPECVQAMVQ